MSRPLFQSIFASRASSNNATSELKMHIDFDGTGAIGLQTIRLSKNIVSANKTATGEYTITFVNPISTPYNVITDTNFDLSTLRAPREVILEEMTSTYIKIKTVTNLNVLEDQAYIRLQILK